nr:MAG TPA: hypothetical protein [Caudoviricetes sp.]
MQEVWFVIMKGCQRTWRNFHITYRVVLRRCALILLNYTNITNLPIHGTNCKGEAHMALTAKKVYAILKRQISDMEAKLNSPVRYRGTVATADLLPLNPNIGDMYNIESKSVYGEAGMNVAWNGVVWDTMGAPIDMSLYLTKEEAETVIQRLVTEYFEKNPVKPGATTEQAQQIEQNKTNIASLKEDLISKADKTSLVKTDRKLDALWKLNQGISYEFQTDDAEAYQKTVPSGAKVASIKSIGGKTIVWNQLNLNNEQSITKNGISFINNKDGSWTINGTCSVSNDEGITTIIYLFAPKYVSGHKYLVKADKYSDENYGFAINGRTYPLKKAIIINYAFNPIIFVKDKVTVDNVTMRMNIFDLTQMFGAGNEPSTPEEFEAMFPADYYPYNAGELMSASVNEVIYLDTKNQETSYPIPQAILDLDGYGESGNFVDFVEKKYHKGDRTIDISDIMGDTFQDPLEVEAGGTLTFKNSHGDDYRIPIPSSEEYVISLAEVAK